MNVDDIGRLLAHIDLKAESKKVEDHDDAKLRRFKERWLFIATLLSLMVMYATCVTFILIVPDSSHVSTALNGVVGLTIALLGYYARGKTQ